MKILSRHEAGFTLVELMIATTIGLFIIAGAGQIYLNGRTTFMTRDTVSAATESARFAIQDLQRTLVMASRGISASVDSAADYGVADNGQRTFPAVSANGVDASAVTGIVDIDSNGSSVIAIRYAQGPAPCATGGAAAISANTTVRFYVDASSNLVCQVGGASQTLVSGVAQMRALYGVDRGADGYADAYWTATQVEASNRWSNVVSMRIGMVVNSGNVALPAESRLVTTETLSLLGSDYDVTDKSLFHKAASTTFLLRNRNAALQRQ